MQLAILAAVLAALTQTGPADAPPLSGLAWRLLLAATAVLAAPLAALVGSRRLVREIADAAAGFADARRLERWQTLVVVLWLLTVAVLLFVAGWPQIVRSNWSLANWPLVDELAILAPVIGSLLLLWGALYRLERAGQVVSCRRRGTVPPPPRPLAYVWLHVRHHLGLIVLPALAVIGAQELFALSGWDTEHSSAGWWLGVPLVLATLVAMPVLVRRIWQTTPLEAGPLRDRLQAICQVRQSPVREILVWHTEGHVANAAVVGLSRWLRYILLTDGLLDRLPPAEIAAVVRHELGHLRRWHLPLRLALLVLPLAWWLTIDALWPGADEAAVAQIAALGIPSSWVATAIVPLAMLLYAVFAIGWYSQWMEHEADLEACTDDRGQLDGAFADDFSRALWRLLGGSRESWFSRWLHPGLDQRLAFIRRALAQPDFAGRFHTRLRWLAAAIVGLHAAAAALAAIAA